MLCTDFDKVRSPYVNDLRWVVILSNDQCIWQDDYNPEYKEPAAWLRLRQYLTNPSISSLFIKRILLEFRGHMEIIDIGEDVDGVFFRKGAGRDLQSEYTQDYFLFGKLRGGVLSVDWWRVPELILERSENRTNIADHAEHIIYRPSHWLSRAIGTGDVSIIKNMS